MRRFLLALTAIALLLSACGDDDSSSTVTSTQTVTEGTTITDEDTSTAEDATPEAGTTVDELTGFSSPTGNIGCMIDEETVRCDISKRDWEPPPAPASCDLDYGQGISLSAGATPELVCAGDTALGSDAELAYGDSIQGGLIRCESEESGITCTDMESGRGFTISQEAYELF